LKIRITLIPLLLAVAALSLRSLARLGTHDFWGGVWQGTLFWIGCACCAAVLSAAWTLPGQKLGQRVRVGLLMLLGAALAAGVVWSGLFQGLFHLFWDIRQAPSNRVAGWFVPSFLTAIGADVYRHNFRGRFAKVIEMDLSGDDLVREPVS
jgi:hypothetical protein